MVWIEELKYGGTVVDKDNMIDPVKSSRGIQPIPTACPLLGKITYRKHFYCGGGVLADDVLCYHTRE